MPNNDLHTFHIPVMGLGFTIDTPLKVARYGISSVISIIEDELIEKMRKHHSEQWDLPFTPIDSNSLDSHATRITAYLDMIDSIVAIQFKQLKMLPFEEGNELSKYFELLPDTSSLKKVYVEMALLENGAEKERMENWLKENMATGSIDVNIMSKVDKMNYSKSGEQLPSEFSDALSSLRGFANSSLQSSVVFSAGYNPRLYAYIENFPDFFPDENGKIKKKIILKVSDYRSALVQSKLLAKRGVWVSEFRIESGLNCGGHAFATDGLLLGPILEEFKVKRNDIVSEVFTICNNALMAKGLPIFQQVPEIKITVQGGIGTYNENYFLMEHYGVNATGWGSPFLLVPEATNVDDNTLNALVNAEPEDYYLSHASPLGVPFNNFRKSSSEKQRMLRMEKGRPGSPCYKKFLSFDTEFSEKPICTASREYQFKKIEQLKTKNLPEGVYTEAYNDIIEKDCLCEGLGVAALIKEGVPVDNKLEAVVICPGPNLAYFSNIFSLQDMVDHIYGRKNILNSINRSNMFVNELNLYVEYLKKELFRNVQTISDKQEKLFHTFKNNLLEGIAYYRNILPQIKFDTNECFLLMKSELDLFENRIQRTLLA